MSLQPFTNTIGLDISDSKIRFAELNNTNAKRAQLMAYGEIMVPENCITSGEIKDQAKVAELIRTMTSKPIYGKLKTKFVNGSLSEKKTFIKTVQIPSVPPEELAGAVGWGIEQNIPVTLASVYYDWFIMNNGKTTDDNKLNVMVSVSPRTLSDQYTSLIKQAGLIPIGLENESTAIARCLLDLQKPNPPSMFIIDLGRSRTNIMMYSQHAIQFAESIDVSGREMTEAVAKELHMTYEDAERAKIITGLDPKKSRGSVRSILEPIMQRLLTRIEEGIYFYENYISKGEKIEQLLLTGSVSRMEDASTYLQEKLKRPVTIGNSLVNISSKSRKQSNIDFISYTTALGLALKTF